MIIAIVYNILSYLQYESEFMQVMIIHHTFSSIIIVRLRKGVRSQLFRLRNLCQNTN